MGTADRKLQSLLELGQLIGLDLQLDEMLLQIARKATQMMEADRFSIFLYDPTSHELHTTVALGMGHRTIRMSADSGIAGCCFSSGETICLEDAHADPRFNRDAEAETGYRTCTLLSMPLYNRAGEPLGVTQLLNKRHGVFNQEDMAFLRLFNNHVAVFIEMAQLQRARIDALEQSRQELERLNRAKTKAIHHVSHELKTPLTVVQGNVRLLKRSLEKMGDTRWQGNIETMERNLNRLTEIQRETNEIMRVSAELEAGALLNEVERLRQRVEESGSMPAPVRRHWNALCAWLSREFSNGPLSVRRIALHPFLQKLVQRVADLVLERRITVRAEGDGKIRLAMNSTVLREVIEGALKNSVENTPDGGRINVVFGKRNEKVYINVVDYGIGITEENQRYVLDGLFPARDTELYVSRKPYQFGAGGKGLDLLKAKLYSERFGFELSMMSKRCEHLPTDRDLCPGDVALCHHYGNDEGRMSCGQTTFTFTFPASEPRGRLSRKKVRGVAA
ncbi:MAG: hypothetical protein H6Q55_3255 [Deltaproteobacteria bacterium]|nr:hypothetical protein [Deltaproteobacteria bacterium]